MGGLELIITMALALAAALAGGMVARRLRQPVLIGYLLGGIAIGPFGLGLVRDLEQVQSLAAIGLIFLLFTLGLELPLGELKRIGWVATLGRLVAIVVTIGLGLAIGKLLGWPLPQSIGFGFLIAVSSTVIILKTLTERGELNSTHGRIIIGYALMDDLAAVPMLIILPALGEPGRDLLPVLSIATLKVAIFLVAVLLLGRWVVPWFIKHVVGMRTRELFRLFVVTSCLGTAYVAHLFGLSPAIGAFIAGLVISQSDFAHQALGDTTPLRDMFAAIFLVSIGMIMNPGLVVENLPILSIIVLTVVLSRLIIFPIITWLFGYGGKTALLVGAGMAPVGEFSFIMAVVGVNAGVISEHLYSLIVAGAIITMVLTPFNMKLVSGLYPRLYRVKGIGRLLAGRIEPSPIGREQKLSGHVVLCGHGGIGSSLARVLERRNFSYLAIDHDPQVISRLRSRETPCIYGDVANPEVLCQAELARARVLVLTIPDPLAARLAAENALRINPRLDIVARVHRDADAELLKGIGVSELVRPEFEASLEITRHTLYRFGLTSIEIQYILSGLRGERLT